MIDFAQAIENRDRQSVRPCHDGGCLDRALQGASVHRRERLTRQTLREQFNLQPPLDTQRHIGRSGKTILGTQFRRAVSHEQDSSRHK
jgi:hypothetical protein